MTTGSTPKQSLAASTWGLLTHRTVTWRQASEGSVVLGAVSAAGLGAAVMVKLTRLLRRRS